MVRILRTQLEDEPAIGALHREVASIPGGIVRLSHEIGDGYTRNVDGTLESDIPMAWLLPFAARADALGTV